MLARHVEYAAVLHGGVRVLAFSAGISAGIVRVARTRRARPGCGVGLRLRQRPGQHRRWPSTSRRCYATDVPPEQIAAAKPHPRVQYSVAPAEHSGFAGGVGGPGDRRAGIALVRRGGVLRRGAARGAARRACSRCGPIRGRSSSMRRLDRRVPGVLRAMWSGRTGRRSGATSRLTTRRCRFRSRNCRTRSSGSSCAGISSRCSGYVSSWSATARYRKAVGARPGAAAARRDRTALAGRRRAVDVRMPSCCVPGACAPPARSAPARRRVPRAAPCRWRPCACARTRRWPGPARSCSRHWRR